jgi:hypothetical protein
MTWHARYTGPYGASASADAPAWEAAAHLLRGFLDAAHPEHHYPRLIEALRGAWPHCGLHFSAGPHAISLRDDTMPEVPWQRQPDLFG